MPDHAPVTVTARRCEGEEFMNALRLNQTTDLPPARPVAELAELWALALPIALLGSWTCFAKLPGVNWALWTFCAAAGFLSANRRSDRPQADRQARTALSLACLVAIAAAVTASPVADALIFLSAAGLCAFALLSLIMPAGEIGPYALLRAPLDLSRALFAEAAARIADSFAALRMREAVPVVRASTLALLLAALLFLLFSAADPTMAGWRDEAYRAILSWTFLARDVFFVLLGIILLGAYGLAARGSPPTVATPGSAVQSAPSSGIRFSGLERLIVLGAGMALFLVFFAAESISLLASPGSRLPAGETLAEATHRGFGEMIVAAALCAVVIITLDQRALRNGRETAIRLLSWTIIAASLIVVASAYRRVRYYEIAYGYTEQRVYVQACCASVSAALLLLAGELRSAIDVSGLMRRLAVACLASIAALSYWNSAAWIVRANVSRYQTSGKLDVSYLERLARSSPDAIPTLIDSLPRLEPSAAARVRESLARSSLLRTTPWSTTATGALPWYEWSLRRAAAQAALCNAGMIGAASSH
jgi:hypothetical protein